MKKIKITTISLAIMLTILISIGLLIIEGLAVHKEYKQDESKQDESKQVIQEVIADPAAILKAADNAPERQSIFLYNPEFAKRFQLDPNQAEALGEGIYAMELVIEKATLASVPLLEQYNSVRINFNSNYATVKQEAVWSVLVPHLATIDSILDKENTSSPYHFRFYLNLYLDSELRIDYPYPSRVMDHHLYVDYYYTYKNRFVDSLGYDTVHTNSTIPGKGLSFMDKLIHDLDDKTHISFGFYSSNVDKFDKKLFMLGNTNKTNFEEKAKHLSYQDEEDIRQYKKDFVPGITYLSIGPVTADQIGKFKTLSYFFIKSKLNTENTENKFKQVMSRQIDEHFYFTYPLPDKLQQWEPLQQAILKEDISAHKNK